MYGLYHPVVRVFTVVSGWSLPSLSIYIYIYMYICIYIYIYVFIYVYINIIHKYSIYLAISKVSTFPCSLKVNNGFQ